MSGGVRSFAVRAALAAALWWILVEGRAEAWLFGTPVVLAAALASVALGGARGLRPRAGPALRALAWFTGRSLLAGADVALRALKPRIILAPAFVVVRTRLRDPAARVLLADSLSLLPGTLCAELEGDAITLHVLDRDAPVERAVREIEARIADALGLAEAG